MKNLMRHRNGQLSPRLSNTANGGQVLIVTVQIKLQSSTGRRGDGAHRERDGSVISADPADNSIDVRPSVRPRVFT